MQPDLPPSPDALADRLVPDELWNAISPLLPPVKVRPQGGGARRQGDRPLLVGIVYVATTGTAWRKVPSWCGASHASLYRRFAEWTTARVWERLLESLGPEHEPGCWCRVVAHRVKQHVEVQSSRQIGRPEGSIPLAHRLSVASSINHPTDTMRYS